MYALTICQPFAHLIISGRKRIENRTWPAPKHIIGQRIAIHAGKSREFLSLPLPPGTRVKIKPEDFGVIVGTAAVAACLKLGEPCDLEYAWVAGHDFTSGPYCWVLTEPKRLPTPLPCKGAQGLWRVPAEVAAARPVTDRDVYPVREGSDWKPYFAGD